MTLLATIVDTSALLKVVVASFVAVVGVTVAVSLAILGATRFADMRAGERPLEATAFAILTAVALAASIGAAVVGVAVMLSK
jgi:hypothetical protein